MHSAGSVSWPPEPVKEASQERRQHQRQLIAPGLTTICRPCMLGHLRECEADRLGKKRARPLEASCSTTHGRSATAGGNNWLQGASTQSAWRDRIRSSAQLVAISPLTECALPADLSALYIGGGFPEVHASALAANSGFLQSLHEAAQNGLPIYAECGGLMVLSRAIVWQGSKYPMAAVLPFEAHVCSTAQGHGYAELLVDRANSFFATGLAIRGHEFHYSRIVLANGHLETACEVRRGQGIGRGRDGVIFKNVWAGYTHIHALATPEWAAGMLRAARQFDSRREHGAIAMTENH